MTIGNDVLPGIITDVESLPSVTLGGISALNGCVVGEGDMADGTAEPNTVYTITRPNAATTLFGRESALTRNVQDALGEGALPVYAVMVDTVDVVGETIDTASGTLAEAPVTESVEDINFTLDSTDYTVTLVPGDPSTMTPDADEVLLNRVTGDYEIDTTPTSGSADYLGLDYVGALDSIQGEDAGELDVIGTIDANKMVSNYLETTLDTMESYHQFALGVVGAGPNLDLDEFTYTSEYDNSRMSVFYPTTNDDNHSIVGSIVGKWGSLGINGSIMNKRLKNHTRLVERLDTENQMDLVGENVVPIASESEGALIVDDLTSVAPDNDKEAEMDIGFNRLVVDAVTELVKMTEEPFIGKLNKKETRGALQAMLTARLNFLVENDAILSYEVRVQERDALSAFVDVSVETISPLRNIYNTVAAGRIE